MKILLVSPQYIGTITGSGGLYVLELSRELAIHNYDVTVLTLGIGSAKDEEIITLDVPKMYNDKKTCQVKVIRFWTEDSQNIKSPFAGSKDEEIKRLKEFNDAVLQYLDEEVNEKCLIHLNGHFMIPSLAKDLRRISQYKIITTIHSLESISEARKSEDGSGRKMINYIQTKERDALINSHYVLLGSNALIEEISWIFPDIYSKIKMKVIPLGIPSGFVEETLMNDEKRSLLKDKYKIDDNFIFNLNRIDPSKGIEYLILGFPKLIKKLRRHHSNKSLSYSLLIAGLLEEKNKWYYDKLINLINNIKDREIRESIHICIDPSIFSDKAFLHKMAKVFVIPSIVAPFGLSLIEAIIKEVPFVVSGIEGILEILNIQQLDTPYTLVPGGAVVSFLNPLNRVEYLVDSLFYILTNHSDVQSSMKDLRKKVIDKYSWNKVIEEITSVYNRV